jgi:glycosidase
LVCEAPADPFGFASYCGSTFAFGHNYDIVAAAKGNSSAVAAVANYFLNAPSNMATMVSNHDAFAGPRLFDQVGGNIAQYKLAAATYLLQPGTPFIYYGEEIGMAGAATLTGDWKLRTPMSWTSDAGNAGFTTGTPFRAVSANVATNNVAAQAADANSLLAHYKALIALRKSYPSLATGSYESPSTSGSVMSYQRGLGAERTLVVINYATTAAASVALAQLPANAVLTPVWPQGGADVLADATGNASIALAAQTATVYRVH